MKNANTLSSRETTPAMICSSATVHAGCSGGALLVWEQHRQQQQNGKDELCPPLSLALAGIITSNSNTTGGTVLPHLNFSIPVDLLRDIWTRAAGATHRFDLGFQ